MFPEDYPRTWSEMSFEFKGMFLYHIAMMVMLLLGRSLSFIEQILIAAAIMLAIVATSFVRRLRSEWHWKGLTVARAGGALLTAALMAYFLFSAAGGAAQEQSFSFQRPFGPGAWVLAGFGIAVFVVLNVLRVTHISESAFREDCGDQALQPQPAPPPEPRWKVITKYVFIAAFLAVWLEGVTFFYVFDRTIRAGSPTPTAERSIAFKNKGVTVYITPAEKQRIDQLQGLMLVGIPSIMAASLFLHFVLKIRISLAR
jgi:hypothetical protein